MAGVRKAAIETIRLMSELIGRLDELPDRAIRPTFGVTLVLDEQERGADGLALEQKPESMAEVAGQTPPPERAMVVGGGGSAETVTREKAP